MTFDEKSATEYVGVKLRDGSLTERDVALLTREFQVVNQLEPDGKPGNATLTRLRQRAAPPPPPSRPSSLEYAGGVAALEAIRLFQTDIWDPTRTFHDPEGERWRDAITEMIRSDRGLGWPWEGRYEGDGDFEWCGAFVARCWSVAGLKLSERRTYFASTFRLRAWGEYRRANEVVENPRPTTGPWRVITRLDEHSTTIPISAKPGDILLVGGVNTGPGKHVTLVEKYDEKTRLFHTIEGNARGIGPDGKMRQGVVRAARPLGLREGDSPTKYHARWLIRPAPSDLE